MGMSLNSLQLDAFVAVAKLLSFSAAAKQLYITQSALSQRVINLENELGASLFVRESSGVRLTEVGRSLLRYCQMRTALEQEFLSALNQQNSESLVGVVKIGGFSSVVRSVLVPSLRPLFQQHPGVQIEFFNQEIRQLPKLLETGEADFILLNYLYDKQGVENVFLGEEQNVLVEPTHGKFREDVFLDHDPEDTTTYDFLKLNSKSVKGLKRSYFDEMYTIIDGVLGGAGRAVVPLHLASQVKGLRVCKGFKPLKVPVYLCYYEQPFYSTLQKKVIETITSSAPEYFVKI